MRPLTSDSSCCSTHSTLLVYSTHTDPVWQAADTHREEHSADCFWSILHSPVPWCGLRLLKRSGADSISSKVVWSSVFVWKACFPLDGRPPTPRLQSQCKEDHSYASCLLVVVSLLFYFILIYLSIYSFILFYFILDGLCASRRKKAFSVYWFLQKVLSKLSNLFLVTVLFSKWYIIRRKYKTSKKHPPKKPQKKPQKLYLYCSIIGIGLEKDYSKSRHKTKSCEETWIRRLKSKTSVFKHKNFFFFLAK